MRTPELSTYRHQLIDVLRPLHPKLGAEIGVYKGHTSYWLLKSFPELTLYLVDPWCPHSENTSFYQSGDPVARHTDEEWTLICKEAVDLTAFALTRRCILQLHSDEAAKNDVPPGLDFVFIDGNHAEDAVYADLNTWWYKLRDGGLAIAHDYNNQGGKWTMGVRPAVDKFAAETGRAVNVGKGFVAWLKK